ncbi:HAMP domain-containing protein [Seongchinamella sediminis]|uniref:histidine kinase n=1 Tax=Seongchinamella sediminis TaxID=2283635 RepID=A0A3L7DZA7_9GAMM|nr:HAMP domain-containing sensor histidine kinase [Seongchinamella sediminis]RLQ21999.1 HAMP domain-containing protein [Seongchinamella sediminis]
MRTSIQGRLFAILGLFVLANTALWIGLAMLLAYVVEDATIGRVMASQIALLQQAYETRGELPAPALPEFTLYTDPEALPGVISEQLRPIPGGGEVFTRDDTHYHYRWLQFRGAAPVILVAEVSPWLVVSRMSPELIVLLVIGFVIALCFGLVAVYFIARMTTRPVRELTRAIATSPRPRPLPHVAQQDEVGVLASAMDGALTGLQDALAREAAFTRDVSHELRTPLTTLRNASTLLSASAQDNPHVAQVARSCREIEGLLAGLLALARAESSLLADIPLRPLLEELLIERGGILEDQAFEVVLAVPDGARARGNEQLTRLLLANLVDNALRYASPQCLEMRLQGKSLLLENPCAGGTSQPHADSLGHGLYLVKRLAGAQSWRFEREATGDKFRVVLRW